eukprot:SAG31_NODE_616_length_13519_cov_2.372876_5_plen_128_part_00
MCRDFVSTEEFYHYGLAAEFYTHFTSPIRRYADVVVHRQLLKSIARTSESLSSAIESDPIPSVELEHVSSASKGRLDLSAVANHMNCQHRMAKAASEMSQELFFALYFGASAPTDGVEAKAVRTRFG